MRKIVERKQPERPLKVSALKSIRLLAMVVQTRPILRPVAHRELRHFIATSSDEEEISSLLKWGEEVLEADFRERYSFRRVETEATVRRCPLPIFSQAHRAFKVRWMFRPRNPRAYLRQIRKVFGRGGRTRTGLPGPDGD
jgi:hypothetical protein